MALFVIIFFIVAVCLNTYCLKKIDVKRLDFLDGILIGQLYYIAVAMVFFLAKGSAKIADLDITYHPYVDLETTAVIISGMILLSLLRIVVPRVRKSSADTSDPSTFQYVVILYISFSIVSFQMSGLGAGGHWQDNIRESLSGNPAFVYIKSASNVFRNVVFGALIYEHSRSKITTSHAIICGLLLSVFDLFLTFNRITAVYFLISLAFILRGTLARVVLAISAFIILPSASLLWPMFRGLATTQGYNYDSFQSAANIASSHDTANTIDETLNSVLESSNIIILDWIVKNIGTPSLPFLGGDMFVRGITVLVPRQLWPNRPSSFGVQIGETVARVPGLSLNSTIYGESFANFGWGWLVALPVFLLALHFLFRLLARGNRAMGAMSAFIGIAIWRFDSTFAIMSLLMLTVFSIMLWLKRDILRTLVRRAGRRSQ